MANLVKCDICNKWHWSDEKCVPEYLVYFEQYLGDVPKSIRANNHENAALEFAQYYNDINEYILIDNEIKVMVEKDGIIKHFVVSAERDIHYSSTEIDN